jgi:hypothetical protein
VEPTTSLNAIGAKHSRNRSADEPGAPVDDDLAFGRPPRI